MEFMSGLLQKPRMLRRSSCAMAGDRAEAMSATNGCTWSDLTERGSTLVKA